MLNERNTTQNLRSFRGAGHCECRTEGTWRFALQNRRTSAGAIVRIFPAYKKVPLCSFCSARQKGTFISSDNNLSRRAGYLIRARAVAVIAEGATTLHLDRRSRFLLAFWALLDLDDPSRILRREDEQPVLEANPD